MSDQGRPRYSWLAICCLVWVKFQKTVVTTMFHVSHAVTTIRQIKNSRFLSIAMSVTFLQAGRAQCQSTPLLAVRQALQLDDRG